MAKEKVTSGTTDRLDQSLLLKALMSIKKGDFSVRLPVEQVGTAGKIYDTLNDIIELLESGTNEFVRISSVVVWLYR
jgi:nitrogen fixation/metabolism regulation signal transduction histidine kinase